MVEILTRNGQTNANGGFDWKDALIDAAITAGLTFFTALGGTVIIGAGSQDAFKVAAIAAAGQFFAFLAVKRGLTKK